MQKVIQRVDFKPFVKAEKLNVCAYARVSISKEKTLHSLSQQVSYYNQMISSKPNWNFLEVYVDEGISGTSKNRENFNRMIEDARLGKIDVIYTKSITRFARNTVDLLETVRELKSLNVEVRFEKENINSLSLEGEMMLSILASISQEESRSISENVKWAFRNNFKKGIGNNFILYGYRWDGEKFNVVEKEAQIIKRIYKDFLDGVGVRTIGKKLREEGVRGVQGALIPDATVKSILRLEKYTGNSLLQKTFRENHITHKKLINNGELPMYWVEDTHPKIIEMETFEKVQEIFNKNKEIIEKRKLYKPMYFTRKIKCSVCGKNYVSSTRRRKDGSRFKFLICSNKKNNIPCECSGMQILVSNLEEVSAKVLGLEDFDKNKFNEEIKQIRVYSKDKVVFDLKNKEEVIIDWKSGINNRAWSDERRYLYTEKTRKNNKKSDVYTGRIECETCGKYFSRHEGKRKNSKSVFYRKCNSRKPCDNPSIRYEILDNLTNELLNGREINLENFDKVIKRITINKNYVNFILKDGSIKTANREGIWQE